MKYGLGEHKGEKMTHADRIHNLGILYDILVSIGLRIMPSREEYEEAQIALANLYTKGDIKEIYKQQAEWEAMHD